VAGSCEHGNESSGTMEGRECLDLLSDNQFLKKDFGPWSYFMVQIGVTGKPWKR
jgi:hypothetical protein